MSFASRRCVGVIWNEGLTQGVFLSVHSEVERHFIPRPIVPQTRFRCNASRVVLCRPRSKTSFVDAPLDGCVGRDPGAAYEAGPLRRITS